MFDVRMPLGWCGVGAPQGDPAGVALEHERWDVHPSIDRPPPPAVCRARASRAGTTRRALLESIYCSRSRGASPPLYLSFYPVLRTVLAWTSFFFFFFFSVSCFMGYPYAAWTGFVCGYGGTGKHGYWRLAGVFFLSLLGWSLGLGFGNWMGWDGISAGLKWTAFTPGRRKRAGVVEQWIGDGGICSPERTTMLGR